MWKNINGSLFILYLFQEKLDKLPIAQNNFIDKLLLIKLENTKKGKENQKIR